MSADGSHPVRRDTAPVRPARCPTSLARLATRNQPVMPPQFDASGWMKASFECANASSNSCSVCRFSPMASGTPVASAMVA